MNLNQKLAKRNKNRNEPAEAIGIATAKLSILTTGKAIAVRFPTLEALCEVLDCQPDDTPEYFCEK